MHGRKASALSRDVQSHRPVPSTYRSPSIDISLSADRIRLLKTWCDMVSNKFGLTQEQLQDLRGTVDFSALCLQPGDIQIRIFQQAALYQTFNAVAAQKVDYSLFQTVLEDTQKRLGAKYSLTKEEVNTVITFTKDAIFQADRTSYMDIHLDVEAILRKKAESLDLLHIFKSDVKT
ncbi:hypothetical protein EV421DRAFT_1743274 [Armillaria borealis]|uniref:Uncharacterized protein n=1 Tax=Armillaria borealis TaxID=47425 RepID=A0AA39IWY8_9AGAR|nr:hypothetical protein EV421DRAFT_1743274 [Armillaria borealis]